MFPGVLLIYGGSWSQADHRWQMRLLARRIAKRGYVVMSAQYRGTPGARFPAPVETYQERPELYREASPITQVTAETPPFFLYHGTGDTTVSPEHTRVFKAALDRAGVRNEVRWLEGKGHAAVLLFGREAADAAIDFLDAVLRE